MKRHAVPVYDAGNKDRLLGYLTHRFDLRGSHHRVVVCGPVRVVTWKRPADIYRTLEYLEFKFGYRMTEDGWRQDGVVFTEAPLKTLMNYDGFRLPGETEEAHKQRRYFSRLDA